MSNTDKITLNRVMIIEENLSHLRVLSHFLVHNFPQLKITTVDPGNNLLPGREYNWQDYDLIFISLHQNRDARKIWYQALIGIRPPAVFVDDYFDDNEALEITSFGAVDYIAKHNMQPERLISAVLSARGDRLINAETEKVPVTQLNELFSEHAKKPAERTAVVDISKVREHLRSQVEETLSREAINLDSTSGQHKAIEFEDTGQITTIDPKSLTALPTDATIIAEHIKDPEALPDIDRPSESDFREDDTPSRAFDFESSIASPALNSHLENTWPFTMDDIRAGRARINYYQILDLIGVGGVASVFRAERDRDGDITAMKIINTKAVADDTIKERFLREFQVGKNISSKHLVEIYAQGFEDDIAYIVMELLDGNSLKDKINHSQLSPRTAINHLKSIAMGLHELHEYGIIHRDLKPGNIMFRNDGTLVLVDFGISKMLHQKPGSTLTKEGEMVGTPLYISPELALGNKIDARSDIYALGLILYEMIRGRHPFAGKKALEVMYQHIKGPVPMLDDEWHEINDILVHMLAKDPDDRFPNTETLLEQVDKLPF